MIDIHFDNLIYSLQASGGVSTYWQELTSRVAGCPDFSVRLSPGNKYFRSFPVLTRSSIFHSSHLRTSPSRQVKNVVTVHDLTYEKDLVRTSSIGSRLNVWERKRSIQNSDAIVCVSHSTKADLFEIYPECLEKPVEVIWHASSFFGAESVSASQTPREAQLCAVPQKFVLYVGSRAGYKNFDSALMGFAESMLGTEGFALVCTGMPFSVQEEAMIVSLGLQRSVRAFSHATVGEMATLYQNALVLLYPSEYEGFGLPPLEAMSCGTPTIAANSSSLPEVLGKAGILLENPQDSQSIAEALNSLLNPEVRLRLKTLGLTQSKNFSWDNSAQAHMNLYRSLCAS
jgi:glycosyltransferase involved in cell wall biosynthesis